MEEGTISKAGNISILELKGAFLEMGRQYGRLLKDRLNEFYKVAIEGYFIKRSGMSYLRLAGVARLVFRRYPLKIKEMLRGMSSSSGIGLNRLIMLDQINVFEFMRNQNIGRCSNIAAWGPYTTDGGLVFGRNFDQPEYFKTFNEFITLTVFSPDDGGIPAACLGYAGQIGVNSAMNSCSLFIANNEAPTLKEDVIDINAPNVLITELELLMRSCSLDMLDRLLRRARANCPIIVSVADEKGAYAYEWTARELKLRSEETEGVMVATNHFADSSWERPALVPGAFVRTEERRRNLLALAEKCKGMFDIQKMKEILSITMDKGGATHRDKTTFQVIISPRQLDFHIKIPGLQDWTRLSLKGPLSRYASTGDLKLPVEDI